MKMVPTVGDSGVRGWTIDPRELEAYFEHMARHWNFLSRLWYWFRPFDPTWRVAYSRTDGGVSIVYPSAWMMAMLKRGDVIRHMRVIDTYGPNGIPVFEGSGELMGPMTDDEAIRFVEWKDVPREVNHRVIMTADDIPASRARRNSWRLGESGIVEA